MITLQERVHSTPKPKGWKLGKLHQILRVRRGNGNQGMIEDNLLSLSYGRVVRKSIDTGEGLLPESFETYQIVEAGDIIMRLTDLQNDKRSLRQGLAEERGIITSAYDALYVVRDNEPRYWFYALLALDMAKYYYSLGGGVRQSVKFSDFPNDWIYLPDLPTQKKVSNFLENETLRIDDLIEKKRRFVSLIDQRRLAVITLAVAGKIGPAAEAIATHCSSEGEIRLRFLLQSSPSAQEIEKLGADDEVTFAPMDALDDGLGGLDESRPRLLSEVMAGSYNYFRNGDVLLAKVTPCFENGKKALARNLINGVGFATSEVYVFRPAPEKLDARFLMYQLSSEDFKAAGMRSMTGSGGLKRVSDAAILNYRPYVVDLGLQRKVADFLDDRMKVFEIIKNRTKDSIERIREYRAALITAAVTGQIDVDTYDRAGKTSAILDRIEEEMQA